ncbi:hypothetical protein HJB76_13270 [Rhizobium lentis]|uniref:hypothetical protein n=1 Tax=Rhizobium lentis TaxID=1138194 RepID=UPI001C83C5EE|nr:hypothetical protein [Rhizobium lentis]MBX4956453.1 hypothetical protein [Rhizobium lentis]
MKNIVKTYIANIVATNVAFGIIRLSSLQGEVWTKLSQSQLLSEREMNKIL